MLTRRDFLTTALKSSGLVALGATVPGFLGRTALAARLQDEASAGGKVLVVVELNGGNDGLNTVVPYADDAYYSARPTLGQPRESLLTLDDHVGLHGALRPLEQLHNDGSLAVLQGVGYPNPNRSHFESMDIWQSARPPGLADLRGTAGLPSSAGATSGWLGRALANLPADPDDANTLLRALHLGDGEAPIALTAPGVNVPSLSRLEEFRLQTTADGDDARARQLREAVAELNRNTLAEENSTLDFLRRTALAAYTSSERLQEVVGGGSQAGGMYYGGELDPKFNLIARLIDADFGTRIFYVSLDGFDTHSDQADTHSQLLGQLAGSVANFFQLLAQQGDADRVLLMTFSEFGRRTAENASRGTDHGAAAPMFVAGPAVQGGVIGAHPSFNDLDDGDLRHHTDFRQVYATLLDQWLEIDSRAVLDGEFAHVPLLAAAPAG